MSLLSVVIMYSRLNSLRNISASFNEPFYRKFNRYISYKYDKRPLSVGIV